MDGERERERERDGKNSQPSFELLCGHAFTVHVVTLGPEVNFLLRGFRLAEDHQERKTDRRSSHYYYYCLLYTSPSPRDRQKTRMPSSA